MFCCSKSSNICWFSVRGDLSHMLSQSPPFQALVWGCPSPLSSHQFVDPKDLNIAQLPWTHPMLTAPSLKGLPAGAFTPRCSCLFSSYNSLHLSLLSNSSLTLPTQVPMAVPHRQTGLVLLFWGCTGWVRAPIPGSEALLPIHTTWFDLCHASKAPDLKPCGFLQVQPQSKTAMQAQHSLDTGGSPGEISIQEQHLRAYHMLKGKPEQPLSKLETLANRQ